MAKGKYKYWLTPEGLLKLEGWTRDGLTEEQIAGNMGISRSTLNEWKKLYPDISDTLKRGKRRSSKRFLEQYRKAWHIGLSAEVRNGNVESSISAIQELMKYNKAYEQKGSLKQLLEDGRKLLEQLEEERRFSENITRAIRDIIGKVEDPEEREVLYCVYVTYMEPMTWERIADRVGCSKTRVMEIHSNALVSLSDLIP